VLEQFVDTPSLTLPQVVEPVSVRDFYGQHNVAQAWVESVIEQKMLRPITAQDGTLMLDEEGQRSFWQIFHDYGPMWRTCPDCPHGGKALDAEVKALRERFTKKT
jgi:hypothetical protein